MDKNENWFKRKIKNKPLRYLIIYVTFPIAWWYWLILFLDKSSDAELRYKKDRAKTYRYFANKFDNDK